MSDGSRVGIIGGLVRVIVTIALFFVLLAVEVLAAMFVYGYMQLAHTELFGWLVRYARGVLDFAASLIDQFFASSANQVYATVFGELGPKSILLLLIGLVVGALFRILIWGAVRMVRGSAR